jgi:hypothetical protein
VEIAARVMTVRCVDEMPSFSQRHALYGWGHVPGASGWAQRCLHGAAEWRTYVRMNRLGLRDREIPYAHGTAARILVLGDSFTEGLQVDLEATVVKRIERALNLPDAPGTHVEVLNAGHSGWSTDNALLYFQHEGWRYHPDVVVLMFNTANDVLENHRPLVTSTMTYRDKPYFRLVDGRLERANYPLPPQPVLQDAATRVYRALSFHSAFVRRLANVPFVWRYLQAPPVPADDVPFAWSGEVYLRDYPPAWREAWRITRGLVLKLRAAVEARGARLVVVVLNGREEVSPRRMEVMRVFQPPLANAVLDPDKPDRLIGRFLARRGIPAVPLLDAFRARFAADGVPGFLDWDMHWADAGHALAADRIARGLRDLGVVPDRASAGAPPATTNQAISDPESVTPRKPTGMSRAADAG